MIFQAFIIGIITSLVFFFVSMFIGNAIFQADHLGPVIVLLALLMGTIIGCSVAIINTIKNNSK